MIKHWKPERAGRLTLLMMIILLISSCSLTQDGKTPYETVYFRSANEKCSKHGTELKSKKGFCYNAIAPTTFSEEYEYAMKFSPYAFMHVYTYYNEEPYKNQKPCTVYYCSECDKELEFNAEEYRKTKIPLLR